MAALGSILKLSSPAPSMNVLMQELALDLADGSYELETVGHIPAVLNEWADALSRLYAPGPDKKEVPQALLRTPRAELAPRGLGWWRTLGEPGGGEVGTSS